MKQKKQKQKLIEIPEKQPNCIDANGHLNIYPILDIAKKIQCPYIAFIGEKRVGKTYGCVGYGLKEYMKDGSVFFYTRRYDKTFTASICGNLIGAHKQDIINLSKGSLNASELRGRIFTLYRESKDKSDNKLRENVQTIAYCRSLNNIETETADDKENVSCIIYDEFLSRGHELQDEFNKIMILHANCTGKRDKFVPMFLLGNTVSKESAVAENFGIDLREIKRGLNIVYNNEGVPRIIVYYLPTTSKSDAAASLFYDRFHNDHINMISHGSWTLGTYPIATQAQLALSGASFLLTHKKLAVKATLTVYGMNPVCIISKADDEYSVRVSSDLSKSSLSVLPRRLVDIVMNGGLLVESNELGEDFRDICKHISGGDRIVAKYA